jgi:anti-anti-sigma factor
MDATILVSRQAQRVVVCIAGELDLASREVLESRCGEVSPVDDEALELVIDLVNVAFVDCGSLRILERLMDSCTAAGGRAQVVAPEGAVRRVLQLTGFCETHDVRRLPARRVSWRAPAGPSCRRAAP